MLVFHQKLASIVFLPSEGHGTVIVDFTVGLKYLDLKL